MTSDQLREGPAADGKGARFPRRDAMTALLFCLTPLRGKVPPLEAVPSSPGVVETDEIDSATIAQAEKLLALEFSDEERTELISPLSRQPSSVETLRRLRPPLQLAPATVFRPLYVPENSTPSSTVLVLPKAPSTVAEEDLPWLPVSELAALLRAKKVTSLALTERALARLKEHDKTLACVITLTEERALSEAKAADREIARGKWLGPLHGIPYGLKDLFAVKGYRTTFGAMPFKDQVIDQDSAVYQRLRDGGAVLCAKLTLGALAMGDRWFGGRTNNPFDPRQGSSGSSAGPAAAVAAGLLPFAIGTETLGSIVSPCARCGTSGLRPTFGRVSRAGAMPLSWTMDKVGPITRSVRDLALVFSVIEGADPLDPSSVSTGFAYDPDAKLTSVRIGYEEALFSGRRAEADAAVLVVLKELGATLVPVTLPDFPAGQLMPILQVEAATVFDEITRDGRVRSLVSQGPSAWPARFRAARFFSAVDFLQADRQRRRLLEAWRAFEQTFDVLVAPSHRGGTLVQTNFTGHPAVVVPNGFRENGTPTAITFIGRIHGDAQALEVAARYQEATEWHRRRPKGY